MKHPPFDSLVWGSLRLAPIRSLHFLAAAAAPARDHVWYLVACWRRTMHTHIHIRLVLGLGPRLSGALTKQNMQVCHWSSIDAMTQCELPTLVRITFSIPHVILEVIYGWGLGTRLGSTDFSWYAKKPSLCTCISVMCMCMGVQGGGTMFCSS